MLSTFPLAAAGTPTVGLLPILLIFLKLGCIVFGSGYVLLAFLRSDLVVHRHWLTEAQLLDTVAIGQVTPGPVFTTATFIGYLLAGPTGAVVATIGIFAPAFAFVAAAGPFMRKLRESPLAGLILDNLNVASLALMAFVTWQLARAAIIDWPTLTIAIISATLLLTLKLNTTWLIAAAAVTALIQKLVQH
jgi:chromate transporter